MHASATTNHRAPSHPWTNATPASQGSCLGARPGGVSVGGPCRTEEGHLPPCIQPPRNKGVKPAWRCAFIPRSPHAPHTHPNATPNARQETPNQPNKRHCQKAKFPYLSSLCVRWPCGSPLYIHFPLGEGQGSGGRRHGPAVSPFMFCRTYAHCILHTHTSTPPRPPSLPPFLYNITLQNPTPTNTLPPPPPPPPPPPYHPSSFTILVFSKMNFPSLYFCASSNASSYFHPSNDCVWGEGGRVGG